MTLKMALRWKSPDSSSDINLRFKDIFNKGFADGAVIVPSGIALEVDVTPFALVNFDGAVVTSDATETLTVSDGQINYVVARARYRLLDSPILQMQVLTEAAYLADPELDWLHVVAAVDLSTGGPYAFVPASQVFYENRNELDKQDRSFWRDPVSTFGSLPATRNRDGDTRLTLDTGSLYWWKTATSTWEIFDEVPLQNHRDREHVNGITGDSAITSLEPDVSGTDMTIDAVPAGSGYTVDGRFVTAPASALTIAASGVGAVRGLIQAALDVNGASVENFRVQKSADVLDIAAARIVNISDGHPLGTLTMTFDNGATALSWNGGEPIAVITGNTYRLFGSDTKHWIDVDLVGALPGVTVSDNYDVNASLKDDTHLLAGYWFWDGAAVLVLGADKRVFGNIGYENVGDDLKALELVPRWNDLRGSMVYSGGTVTDLGGLSARVSGPIVAYIAGIRYEVAIPGGYTGVGLTDATTNYLYIDSTGTFAIQTGTAPTGDVATVARVVTAAGAISSIVDERDPQIIIGNATRVATAQFAADSVLELTPGVTTDFWKFKRGGLTSNANLQANRLVLDDYLYATAGVRNEVSTWTDAGSGDDHRFEGVIQAQDIYIARSTDQDIGDFMVGSSTPNLLGSLRHAQEARQFVRGVANGCIARNSAGTTVQLEAGRFVDGYGRLVVIESGSEPSVNMVSDNTWIVYWDSSAASLSAVPMSTGISPEDEAFAVVVRAAGVITNMASGGGLDEIDDEFDIRRFSNGEYNRDRITVGDVNQNSLNGAHFDQMRKAVLFLSCQEETTGGGKGHNPKHIMLMNDRSSAFPIDLTKAHFSEASSRLEALRISGWPHSDAVAVTELLWNTQEPLFNLNAKAVHRWNFDNIRFRYGGTEDLSNTDICFFKDTGEGFKFKDCVFDSQAPEVVTTGFLWAVASPNFGASNGSARHTPTIFDGCTFVGASATSGNTNETWFTVTGNDLAGKFVARDCIFDGTVNRREQLFRITGTSPSSQVLFDHCDISYIESALIDVDGITLLDNPFRFNRCKLSTNSTSFRVSALDTVLPFENSRKADFINCEFADDINLYGANLVSGCFAAGTTSDVITGYSRNTFMGCDFSDISFNGDFHHMIACRILIGTTAGPMVIAGPAGATEKEVRRFMFGNEVRLQTTAGNRFITIGASLTAIGNTFTWPSNTGDDNASFFAVNSLSGQRERSLIFIANQIGIGFDQNELVAPVRLGRLWDIPAAAGFDHEVFIGNHVRSVDEVLFSGNQASRTLVFMANLAVGISGTNNSGQIFKVEGGTLLTLGNDIGDGAGGTGGMFRDLSDFGIVVGNMFHVAAVSGTHVGADDLGGTPSVHVLSLNIIDSTGIGQASQIFIGPAAGVMVGNVYDNRGGAGGAAATNSATEKYGGNATETDTNRNLKVT